MYFVKYHPLKARLSARSVSDREALPYLIMVYVINSLLVSLPDFQEYNFWDGVSAILTVAVTIGGILHVYRKNGGASGFDLIRKYVILGWVVTIRCLLAFIPVAIVFGLAEVAMGITSSDYGPQDVVLILLLQIIVYQRIGRHISDTTVDLSGEATVLPADNMGHESSQS